MVGFEVTGLENSARTQVNGTFTIGNTMVKDTERAIGVITDRVCS